MDAPPLLSVATPPARRTASLQESGAPEQKVQLQTVVREGREVDLTVAAAPLQPGDIALRIPEHLIVTLDRVLEDNTLAELLTTGKLSGEHPASPKKAWCQAVAQHPPLPVLVPLLAGRTGAGHNATLLFLSVLRPCAELACLTLYLAYEKKRGTEGCWYRFIKELDRMQGRGSQVRGSFHQHATSAQALQPGLAALIPLEALDADVTDGREEPCLLSSS